VCRRYVWHEHGDVDRYDGRGLDLDLAGDRIVDHGGRE
jgi:hypothetical protein